jgi:hypothetical protein
LTALNAAFAGTQGSNSNAASATAQLNANLSALLSKMGVTAKPARLYA